MFDIYHRVRRPAHGRSLILVAGLVLALLLATCAAPRDATPVADDPITVAETATPTVTPVEVEEAAPTATPIPGVSNPQPDFLPDPRLCGENPPLTELVFDEIEADDDEEGVFVARAPYENESGTYEVRVQAGSEEALKAFTQGEPLLLCLETIPDVVLDDATLRAAIPPSREPVIALLLSELVRQTGRPVEDVTQRPDTARQIADEQGLAIDEVIAAVAAQLQAALDAGALDNLPDDMQQALLDDRATEVVAALVDEPNLFVGVALGDDRPLEQILQESPDSMVITFEPTGDLAGSIEERYAAFYFVLDPPLTQSVNRNGWHYYVAHCATYAFAQIHVDAIDADGSMTLVFRRIGVSTSSSVTTAASPWSALLQGSSAAPRSYDAEVSATADGLYTIYGGWVRGFGGFCPDQ